MTGGPAETARHNAGVASVNSSVLDFLRALAVCLVLADHIWETTRPVHPIDWRLGRLGVLLFFVHTSCVLMMSLQRTGLTGRALALNFYVRRAFRIYPLSVVTVLAVMLFAVPVAAWYPDPVSLDLRGAVSNLLLMQNIAGRPSVLAPLWSLPLEIQMYAVLPAVFWCINRRRNLSAAVGLWFLAAAIAVALPMFNNSVIPFAPCFMAGVLAYCLTTRVKRTLPFWTWPITLALLVVWYLEVSARIPEAHSRFAAWSTTLAAGLLLPLYRENTSNLVRRVAASIATYSYGIYLAHMIALWMAFVVLSRYNTAIRWGSFAALMIALPFVAYHAIEAPMIRLGARVIRSRAPISADASVVAV